MLCRRLLQYLDPTAASSQIVGYSDASGTDIFGLLAALSPALSCQSKKQPLRHCKGDPGCRKSISHIAPVVRDFVWFDAVFYDQTVDKDP